MAARKRSQPALGAYHWLVTARLMAQAAAASYEMNRDSWLVWRASLFVQLLLPTKLRRRTAASKAISGGSREGCLSGITGANLSASHPISSRRLGLSASCRWERAGSDRTGTEWNGTERMVVWNVHASVCP